MIAIIDYGSGNVQAIQNMLEEINVQSVITSDENLIDNADKLILAGVGHFDFTMKRLRNMGLINILERNVINKKKYILGICVGMQILGNSSEEGKESGIGWINGKIEKIKLKHDTIPNLPHMGWNSISCNGLHPLLDKLDFNLGFYFLHSYHFNCQNNSNELASFSYHSKYSAVVGSKNVLGVQFHPEKSHTNGKILLKNFSIL